jgi:hypothetical protein
MSDWTLGGIKAHNLALEGHCRAQDCKRFYAFDLDRLIEENGADFRLDDIPTLACGACGAPLKLMLAGIPADDGEP